MENEFRYVHFPLFLIKDLFSPKNQETVISNIFDLGIYNYSKQFQFQDFSAYSQVIYCYYRGGLTDELHEYLQNLYDKEVLTLDQDYNGFNGLKFEPYELDELCEYAKDHTELRELCIEFYKMDLAMKSLNLTGSIERILGDSKEILKLVSEHERRYGNEPSVMLKTDFIFDYYKKTKSFNEIILFAAYAGIKSIIGKKDFAGTTKKMIIARMIGAKSDKVLQDFLKNKELKKIYDQYIKRYWFDKLIAELLKRGFVKSKMTLAMGLKSRIYLSCKLDYDQLPAAIADYWNAFTGNKKLKELKAQEQLAIKQFRLLITAP